MIRAWERFLKDRYRGAIVETVQGWPRRRSFTIDWYALQAHDSNLAEFLLKHPYEALAHAKEAVKSIDIPSILERAPRLEVRVGGFRRPKPGHDAVKAAVEIRDLRTEDLGRLVVVSGLVTKRGQVLPRAQDAVFVCVRCGCAIRVPQDEHLALQKPTECYEDQGGCGRESKFKLVVGSHRGQGSLFIDTQRAELQEPPELARSENPRKLEVFLEDDLCDQLLPGRRAILTGVLRVRVRKENGVESTIFDRFLEVNHILHDDEATRIDVTPAEEAEVRRLNAEHGPAWLVERFAPTLVGVDVEKNAVLLQAAGCPPRRQAYGQDERGDLHVLFIGDPGVAKTALLNAAASISPRVERASGGGASGVGLTAAVAKDEDTIGAGAWSIRAGTLARADLGLAVIDELDKMDHEDSARMHEAMESQRISVSKAGLSATLSARCAVLAGANPKDGRFTEFQAIRDQVQFPPALLSRFDVILPMRDVVNTERDGKVADAVLHGADTDPQDIRLLRVWIELARRIDPTLTPAAANALKERYIKTRRTSTADGSDAPPGARQLQAARRLTIASARLHLRAEATEDDADVAFSIMDAYLDRCKGEDGKPDVDAAMGFAASGQRRRKQLLENIISTLQDRTPDGAPHDEILQEAEKIGIPRKQADATLRHLASKRGSTVTSERTGFYRTTTTRRG